MDYRLIALRQTVADEVRATMKAPGYGHPAHVETATGTGPCRLCLRPFRVGEEERVLFTFNPFGNGCLPSPGPVFVHKTPCVRFEGPGFPAELLAIPLAIETYDDHGVALQRVHTNDPEAAVPELLARPGVAYAHARHAEAGCYVARIDRMA